MNEKQVDFFEQVRVSGRVFAILGLLLGGTAGALTGVAIKGLVDEPVVSGGNAVLFYVAFGFSTLIALFVMLNYTMMSLTVSDDLIEISIGMRKASVATRVVSEVRVAQTQSRMSRAISSEGRKAPEMWTVLGVGSGVEIDVAHEGRSRTWFVASRDPEALYEAVSSRLDNASRGSDAEADESVSEPASETKS